MFYSDNIFVNNLTWTLTKPGYVIWKRNTSYLDATIPFKAKTECLSFWRPQKAGNSEYTLFDSY